jgi:hypothetical protein
MRSQHTLVRAMKIVGGISLVSLPLLLAVAFALHYSRISDFFVFHFIKPEYSVEHLLQTLTNPDVGYRHYVLPHLLGYMALPLFIFSALALAYAIFKTSPWHALMGAGLTCIGVVFLAGVFGAWLSFAAVADVPAAEAGNLIPVLTALTRMQGPLLISSTLSALTFLGMIILGFGLYHSRIISRWSAAVFILGHVLILVFIDLDNWMLIGAVCMFIGIFPLARIFLHRNAEGQVSTMGVA